MIIKIEIVPEKDATIEELRSPIENLRYILDDCKHDGRLVDYHIHAEV